MQRTVHFSVPNLSIQDCIIVCCYIKVGFLFMLADDCIFNFLCELFEIEFDFLFFFINLVKFEEIKISCELFVNKKGPLILL